MDQWSFYLVIRADGTHRTTSERGVNRIRNDEVGFKVNVDVPEGWGTVAGEIDIEMPEPPRTPTMVVFRKINP